MRIIQIIQKPQLRGAELFACQLSNHLVEMGHEVKIVALFEGDAKLPFEGEVICLGLNRRYWFFDLKGWRRLAKVIDTFKAEVVQANAGDTLKYVVLAKFFLQSHPKLIFRNASTMSAYIQSRWVKLFYGYLLRKVDRVISVSEMSKLDIKKLFPFLGENVSVIPIGINPAPYTPFQPDYPYIVHVGGFTFEKNHLGLIRIFSALSIHHPEMKLLLVGDGPLKETVSEAIDNAGMAKKILMLGFQQDVMRYIGGAEALVLPSIIEGLPSVILEAMYCRVPVIAYNVGGIEELISSSQVGFLVEAKDEMAFVDALDLCIRKNEDITLMINRAHEVVSENYLLKTIAAKFAAHYRLTFHSI